MQWRGVRRLSVCKLLRKSLLLAGKWPDRDQTCTGWSPGEPASRGAQGQGQRSRDTGTFVLAQKQLLLAGKWLDRHQTCTRWSPAKPASRVFSRSRSKVMWFAHFLGFLEWATPSLTVWFVLLLARSHSLSLHIHSMSSHIFAQRDQI